MKKGKKKREISRKYGKNWEGPQGKTPRGVAGRAKYKKQKLGLCKNTQENSKKETCQRLENKDVTEKKKMKGRTGKVLDAANREENIAKTPNLRKGVDIPRR